MRIKKGLDIPIAGEPSEVIDECNKIKECAILGADYIGLKPKLSVQEGDTVAIGTPLFVNKDNPEVKMTAPCSGQVVKINRGYRRVLQSIVIADDGKNKALEIPNLPSLSDRPPNAEGIQQIKKILADCGQWVAFRTRPFSIIPDLSSTPNSIFVTAVDTNPLAFNPQIIINQHQEEFISGLKLLSVLSPFVHLCTDESATSFKVANNVIQHHFSGVHPAGLAGTHVHYIDPIVNMDKTVWTINYQEVIALGHLNLFGRLWTDRYISLCGPCVRNPRIIKLKLGSHLHELTHGELSAEPTEPLRIISGSILHGRQSEDGLEYLGRYHLQVSVIKEGIERPPLHYVQAGRHRFSKLPIYVSKLIGEKKWNFTSTTNGSSRAMVPIGIYEEIMPLNILPTQLLRALIVGDSEMAQQLGCLELDEEDLALCTYVCPGKYEYGPILRDNLQRIQKEG